MARKLIKILDVIDQVLLLVRDLDRRITELERDRVTLHAPLPVGGGPIL